MNSALASIQALDERPGRPLWLITLADLALLLVGFFVLLQATHRLDPHALTQGLRGGFGAQTPAPMAVDLARLDGFAAGSSALPGDATVLGWARTAATDPRTRIRVTGEVDGTRADRDPVTGSGAILAADRARALAARLATAGIAPDRLVIATASGRRAVELSIAFAGDRP